AGQLHQMVEEYCGRITGVQFGRGGDMTFVIYDKTLYQRLYGPRFMEPIWATNGWDGKARVLRYEVRLAAGALRMLGEADGTTTEVQRVLDDPRECLLRQAAVWQWVVGLPDACPSECPAQQRTRRGWIRLAVRQRSDRNRSRWPTDPAWRIVQAARFDD